VVTDPRDRDLAERERQRQLLNEFLGDATRDVERMRALLVELEGGQAAAWTRVSFVAHNIAARATNLKLLVLAACARELEQLAEERQAGAPLDKFFMQCVASAIETLGLEIASLRRA